MVNTVTNVKSITCTSQYFSKAVAIAARKTVATHEA